MRACLGASEHTLGLVWPEIQAVNVHVLDGFWVVAEDAKIVDGIAIDGVAVDFLMVVEDAVAPKRTRANHMPVRQDVSVEQGQVVSMGVNGRPKQAARR